MSGSAPATVAVVSFNTRELLARCLDSLEPVVAGKRAEVWVVDNDSSDGSADLVAERFGWAQLIRAGSNLGFGPAVNLVAERTGSEWLVASNADVELRPGALELLLRCGELHPEAGVIAPRLLTPGGATQHSVHPFPGPALALAFNLGLFSLVPGLGRRLAIERYWDPDRPAAVGWAHGAFLLIRRSAFDRAGGFDPDQWMYAEDTDLCWRMAEQGFETRYEPAARVRHEGSAAASAAFGDERLARHLAAALRWQRRRRGRLGSSLALWANVAGARARWAANVPLSWFSPLARARRDAYGAWAKAHVRAARHPDDFSRLGP